MIPGEEQPTTSRGMRNIRGGTCKGPYCNRRFTKGMKYHVRCEVLGSGEEKLLYCVGRREDGNCENCSPKYAHRTNKRRKCNPNLVKLLAEQA